MRKRIEQEVNTMVATKREDQEQQKEPRDLRLRKQYFPDAENLVFHTSRKGFVPLPIVMRKLMRHVSQAELRVLVYLQTRCSQYFICYPALEEIVHDLGLTSRRNLTPHLTALGKKRFISTETGAGKKFFLIHDPRVAIEHMVKSGDISDNELFEINELLRDLRQEPIAAKPKAPAAKPK
jgi:hypothetical protein